MRIRTCVVRSIAGVGIAFWSSMGLAQGAEDSTKADKAGEPASVSLPSDGPGNALFGVEVGYRGFLDEPARTARAKLEEYKAVPTRLIVLGLHAGYTLHDSITVLEAKFRNLGQRDQVVRLRANNPGLYDLQLRWDRIPHTFSTNARALGNEVTRGVFILPAPRPDTGEWNRNSPYLSPVRTQWEAVRLAAGYTPSSRWDLRTEYTNLGKTGRRPIGMAFGSPGSNFREVMEPIDQTMQDLKFAHAFSGDRLQAMATYDLSLFHNRFSAVTSDNPLLTNDLPTTGSSRGRVSLAPSNLAHTGLISAGLNLPRQTRINAAGSYSLWIQNKPFIPPTINSAITNPKFAELPERLGGRSGTSSFYLSGVGRPTKAFTLTAKLRTFSFRDNVRVDSIPVRIVNDRSTTAGEEREHLPFTRRNADAAATWRFSSLPVVVTSGYGWESWSRSEARNVAHLRESSPRVSADFGVLDWVSLRSSYTMAKRRIRGEYIQNMAIDNPLHRRFDQADRDRTRANLLATITPRENLMLSGTWTVGHDEYPNSAFGLQSDRSNAEEGDVYWAPNSRFSLDGSLIHERFLTRLRSKYRTTGQLNNPTFDWVANNRDEIRTASAGFRATLISGRLEANGRVSASRAKFRMATYNPTTPTGGTAAQNLAATASDLPEVTQKFQPMSLAATYLFRPDWGMTFRFESERWAQNDFRTAGLLPAEGGVIFLGNNLDNYNARYITLSVSYRPRLLLGVRPAL